MSSGRRCRKRLRFLQSRFVSMGEKTDGRWQETEGPTRAESATRRSRISKQYASAADPHPSRILSPAGAAQERRYRGHHRDVRFRAHRTAGNRAGAMHTVEKREYLEDVRGRAGPAPRGSASREELAGDVALLRRSARAFDRASTRAIRESLHQPGAELQFQILLHAQTVVRAARQGAARFSRRFRHHGRTVGNADAAANRKTCQAEYYSDLRPQVLG